MSGLRILLVDDEEPVLRACARALREIPGAEIVEQNVGGKAAELLDTESFDLLISDVRMPGMNGLRLLEIARQRAPKLPVILITGFATDDTVQGSVRLGAAACLMKPIRPDELLEIVQRVLARDRLRPRTWKRL